MRYPLKLTIERRRVVLKQREQEILLLLEIPVERALARPGLRANIIDSEVSKPRTAAHRHAASISDWRRSTRVSGRISSPQPETLAKGER